MNKQIRRLAGGLLVCYLILFVQLNLLQVVKRDELATNTNNNRAVLRDFDKPRGEIVAADGVVVAMSVPSTDTEFKYQRVYPTADLFANVTGYYTYAFGATKLEKKYTEVLTGRTSEQQVRNITNLFSGQDNTGSAAHFGTAGIVGGYLVSRTNSEAIMAGGASWSRGKSVR